MVVPLIKFRLITIPLKLLTWSSSEFTIVCIESMLMNHIGGVMVSMLASSGVMVSILASSGVMVSMLTSSGVDRGLSQDQVQLMTINW